MKFPLAGLALAFTLAAGAGHAAPVLSYSGTTDAGFVSYLAGRGASLPANEVAVAQARTGNNALNGDYEAGLHVPPNFTNAGPVGTPGQIRWGSGGASNPSFAFTLSRTGTALTFTLGSYDQTWTNALVPTIDALGLRVVSTGANTSTSVNGLTLDGTSFGAFTASGGGLSYALLEGFGAGDFTLTGAVALGWPAGALPQGSRLGFQIKAIDLPVGVPVPGALGLFGAALLGLGAARRRRRAAA